MPKGCNKKNDVGRKNGAFFGCTTLFVSVLFLTFFNCSYVAAKPLPDKLFSAILLKLVSLEKNISQKGSVTIHLLGEDRSLYRQLNKFVGVDVGESKLTQVTMGESFPAQPPDILVVNRRFISEVTLHYTQTNGVLSVAEYKSASKKMISVVIYNDSGVPGINLNIKASQLEKLDWRPEVLEIAEPIK